MCGLFGWKFLDESIPLEDRRVCSTILGINNDIRGGDSWGVINYQTREVYKDLGKIKDSYMLKAIGREPVILAHTRFGTTGGKTIENAHPFYANKTIGVLGMHNGVINNHLLLNKKYEREHAVDSQHIFSHIDEGLPLEEVEGYGAITYLRDDSDYIYLGRFNAGVLAVARVYESKKAFQEGIHAGIVWSSDATHLASSLRIAGIVYHNVVIDENRLYSIREDDIYVEDTLVVGKRWTNTTTTSKDYSTKYNNYMGYRSIHGQHCPCTECWNNRTMKRNQSIVHVPTGVERFYSAYYTLADKKEAQECYDLFIRKKDRLAAQATDYEMDKTEGKKAKMIKTAEQIEALSYTMNRSWKLLTEAQRADLWMSDVEDVKVEALYL